MGRSGPENVRFKGGWKGRGGNARGGEYFSIWVAHEERASHPTVNKRGYMRRSHYVWNQAHPDDVVQPGELIHHRNEDTLDDRPENLEKIETQSRHARLHFAGVPKSPRHVAAQAEAQRSNWRNDHPDRPCENCGTLMLDRDGRRFCSQACHYAFRKGKGRSGW